MEEREEIIIASLALSLSFTIAFFGFSNFMENFIKVLIFVSPSFILHELAHKYSAISFGSKARFFLYPTGLALGIITAFLGFIFAAPGAVYIFSKLSRFENGIVSLVGPITNILLAIFLYLISYFVFIPIEETNLLYMAGKVNAILAFFNLIPILPLDGAKVFSWNKGVWLASILFSLVLYIFF